MGTERAPRRSYERAEERPPTAVRAPSAGRPGPLPAPLQTAFEQRSGLSLAGVEVHYDSPEANRMGAFAFAQGSRIHLGPGQERHLAHETWHVVQQRQGRVAPTTWIAGQPANTDRGLEAESDRMAAAVGRVMRSATGGSVDDVEAPASRIRRTTLPGSGGGGVVQGMWRGLRPEQAAEAYDDPTGWLLRWARHNVNALGTAEREGIAILAAVEAHPGSDEFVSIVEYLESTVRSSAEFTLDYLLRQIRVQAGLDPSDMAVLDGSDGGTGINDHVEDDRPPEPEEPVELWNLYKLDLETIPNGDPALGLIAGRIVLARPSLMEVFQRAGSVRNGLLLLQFLVLTGRLAPFAEEEGEGEGEPEPMQGKFKSGTVSGPKDYTGSSNNFAYQGITYTRDTEGSINFRSPTQRTNWTLPVQAPVVLLTRGTKTNDQGLLQNGNLVKIARANRAQHFNMANRIVANGRVSDSPPNRTWHHLTAKYKMVLVDRKVHQQHGHNGGFLIWN